MDEIVTERLRLRPFTSDDAAGLFDLFGRPEVARWSGQGVPMTDISEAVARINGMGQRAGENPVCGIFATERLDTGEFVGSTLLVPIPVSGEAAEEGDEASPISRSAGTCTPTRGATGSRRRQARR